MERFMNHIHLGGERVSCFLSPRAVFHHTDTFLRLVIADEQTFVGSFRDPSSVCHLHPLSLSLYLSLSMRGKESKFIERYCFSDPATRGLRRPADPQRIAMLPLRGWTYTMQRTLAWNCIQLGNTVTSARLPLHVLSAVNQRASPAFVFHSSGLLWCFEVVVLNSAVKLTESKSLCWASSQKVLTCIWIWWLEFYGGRLLNN